MDIISKEPTVIPAQPGFKVVTFRGPKELTETTQPGELEAYIETIIAWIIHPLMRREQSAERDKLYKPEVLPVLVDGSITARATQPFIVDPAGMWILQNDCSFASEEAARRYWIERELDRLPQVSGA